MIRTRFVGLALIGLLAWAAPPSAAAPADNSKTKDTPGDNRCGDKNGKDKKDKKDKCNDGTGGPALATYQLGAGWATFGLALPQGAARYGVSVGSLETQTDVKTTWPDGSIRFAVVTTQILEPGAYTVSGRTAPYPAGVPFRGATPAASVQFDIAGQTWTANLPAALHDWWLDGVLASEGRVEVAPATGGTLHPYLRVVFDVRAFSGGGHRLDVAVENVLDVAEADQVAYDVTIRLAGNVVFSRTGVQQPYLSRWRGVFSTGLQEASVVPDFAPFIAAHAIPAYSPASDDPERSAAGPQFDILQIGDLHDPMNDHGGRPELAPYPDWTAQYLVHRRPDQRAYMMKHGDLAGTYSIHIKEGDTGNLISIDDRPNFWLDSNATEDPAKNGLRGLGYNAEINHQPSLAYVPYLVTGDRYYADEIRYWANFCLIGTFQDSFYNARGGSLGSLMSNEVRGIGWALRNIGDAAAYLPDSDPFKAYFAQKLQNNLDLLDSYASTFSSGPLETLFPGRRPEDQDKPPFVWIAPWEHSYVAWAIDHVGQHGYVGGTVMRDRIARLYVLLFNSGPDDYPREYGAPYVLAIGTVDDVTGFNFFETVHEVFAATYVSDLGDVSPPVSFVGSYGPEARLMLMIGDRAGMGGAASAYDYLMGYVDADGSVVADLNHRSGWNIQR